MRNSKGVYMIELIMAIAISALLSAALIQAMAESMRLANSAQTVIQMNTIEAGILDYLRTKGFAFIWDACIGKQYVVSQDGKFLEPVFVRPTGETVRLFGIRAPYACRDQGFSKTAEDNVFRGTVTLKLQQIDGSPNTAIDDKIHVEVLIDWLENNSPRHDSIDTVICRAGCLAQ